MGNRHNKCKHEFELYRGWAGIANIDSINFHNEQKFYCVNICKLCKYKYIAFEIDKEIFKQLILHRFDYCIYCKSYDCISEACFEDFQKEIQSW